MGNQSSFIRQAAILGASITFVRLLGFFYRVPITNMIGDAGNSYYVLAFQVFSFAIILPLVALKTSVVKLTSERIALQEYRNAHEMFRTAMGISLVSGVVSTAVLFFMSNQIAGAFLLPEASYAIRAIAPAVMFVSVMGVVYGRFQGMKTVLPTSMAQIIDQVFKAFFAVFLTIMFFDGERIHMSAAAATFATSIGTFAALVLGIFVYIRKRKTMRCEGGSYIESRLVQLKTLFVTTLPIYVGALIFVAANLVDIRMLSSRLLASGAFEESDAVVLVGQFTGKFVLLTTMPASIAMALSQVVLPEISASISKKDIEGARAKTNKALRMAMLVAFPSAVGLTVLAAPILELLFPNYPEGGVLLQYGSVSIVFMGIFLVTQSLLQGAGFVWLPAISAFCGVLAKIPINYLLIYDSRINVAGVAISTVVCFLVASFLNVVFVKKYVGFMPNIKKAVTKPLLASVLMGTVCILSAALFGQFVPYRLATVFAIFFGGFVYLLLLLVLKGIEKEEVMVMPLPNRVKVLVCRLMK